MHVKVRLAAALALALTILCAGGRPAAAQTTVSSRAALGGDDFVDWSVLGPAGTVVSSPFTVNSNGGLAVTGSKSGTFRTLVQHTPVTTVGVDWQGNFARGDALLYTNTAFGGGVGPIDLTFGAAVTGAGAQVMTDNFGAFTGTITAFDSSNNVILSSNFNGVANLNEDNSAVFIGIKSNVANIKRLRIDAGNSDFVINRLDILRGSANAVPEPASLALALPGILPFGFVFLRRRKQAA